MPNDRFWPMLVPLAQGAPSPVADLSAQRAEAERGKISEAGLAYSRWLAGRCRMSRDASEGVWAWSKEKEVR